MKQNLRIALAQINCTVGDLKGNLKKINEHIQKAEGFGVDIIAFPELAITGYPPEDLLLKPKFVEDNLESLKELVKFVNNIVVIVGFVDKKGRNLYNAAAVIYTGKIIGTYHKMLLPNYGVFDEKRYFKAGDTPLVFSATIRGGSASAIKIGGCANICGAKHFGGKLGNIIFGVNICEDIWHKEGPTSTQAQAGAKLIVNINASPYHMGKIKEREKIIQQQAKDNRVFIAYTNLVGGQDELVFDGRSMIVNPESQVISQAEAFKEYLLIADPDIPADKKGTSKKAILVTDKLSPKEKEPIPKRKSKAQEPIAEVYQALLLGLKDYVLKNGFQKVVIGLSGGIDSSLVATLATDALGKDNVFGVFMPSRYSSQESEADAKQLAQNLGIKIITISIEQIYKIYLLVLESHFIGRDKNITEENLQARIRGNILMALSNKFGWLVLTTGNKSEMSTGYATLYGDMAGGFAVIKDVPKTLVYKLAKYRNSLSSVIPECVFTKEPTAELKPNQKDSDTLPVYETLDPILKAYIEEDKDLTKIVSLGFDKETVQKVLTMVDKSEYKRRQSPPGIKITPKAFGRDRRMPITNKYRG